MHFKGWSIFEFSILFYSFSGLPHDDINHIHWNEGRRRGKKGKNMLYCFQIIFFYVRI
jgi:hypothetical protein